MSNVIELRPRTDKTAKTRGLVPEFTEEQDPEGTGNNCAVLAAYMEDSMGGMDQDRFDHAIETCECDTCK